MDSTTQSRRPATGFGLALGLFSFLLLVDPLNGCLPPVPATRTEAFQQLSELIRVHGIGLLSGALSGLTTPQSLNNGLFGRNPNQFGGLGGTNGLNGLGGLSGLGGLGGQMQPNQFGLLQPNGLGQGANQFGQNPNQFGQLPSQFGQNPNQFGQGQFGQQPNQFGGQQQPNQFGGQQQPNQFGGQQQPFGQSGFQG